MSPGLIGRCGGGSTYTPPTDHEWVDITPTTIGSVSGGFIPWTHIAGSALLDYSVPNRARPITPGIYSASCHVFVQENVNAGALVRCSLQIQYPLGPAGEAAVSAAFTGPTGGGTGGFPLTAVSYFDGTSYFEMFASNLDSIAHNVGDGSGLTIIQRIT